MTRNSRVPLAGSSFKPSCCCGVVKSDGPSGSDGRLREQGPHKGLLARLIRPASERGAASFLKRPQFVAAPGYRQRITRQISFPDQSLTGTALPEAVVAVPAGLDRGHFKLPAGRGQVVQSACPPGLAPREPTSGQLPSLLSSQAHPFPRVRLHPTIPGTKNRLANLISSPTAAPRDR
jgi:hypothetical protein